jgi:hypothetical protein
MGRLVTDIIDDVRRASLQPRHIWMERLDVTDMSSMFEGVYFNQISWDVSSVTNMYSAFAGRLPSFNQKLSLDGTSRGHRYNIFFSAAFLQPRHFWMGRLECHRHLTYVAREASTFNWDFLRLFSKLPLEDPLF